MKADLQIGDGHIEAARRTLHQAMDALSVSTPTGEGEETLEAARRRSEHIHALAREAGREMAGNQVGALVEAFGEVAVAGARIATEAYEANAYIIGRLGDAVPALAHPQQGGERDGRTEGYLAGLTEAFKIADFEAGAWGHEVGSSARVAAENIRQLIKNASPTSPSKSSGEEA